MRKLPRAPMLRMGRRREEHGASPFFALVDKLDLSTLFPGKPASSYVHIPHSFLLYYCFSPSFHLLKRERANYIYTFSRKSRRLL